MLDQRISFTRFQVIIFLVLAAASCSVNHHINKQANALLFKDSAISHAHMGISIYDPAKSKYLYNHNAEKYFIPASNTKLFSLYAGMKYLGDSLTTASYAETPDTLYIFPAGDPSFLNNEYSFQPLLSFLQKTNKPIVISDTHWREQALGYGWAWDDYNEYYMAERAAMPVYGNLVTVSGNMSKSNILPTYFAENFTWDSEGKNDIAAGVSREKNENVFNIRGTQVKDTVVATFTTKNGTTNYEILGDVLSKNIFRQNNTELLPGNLSKNKLRSIPADSLFKPMMHRSDNFYAEQTLLMASNELLGYMNDADMISRLLTTDLTGLPQQPKWVDGSGLSRYNLFTPQDFIFILQKLKEDFGLDRLKNILATGGEGTLRNYYTLLSRNIYAKTGTLSNNCALSGYLYTKKGKLLLFSVLANNYNTSAAPVRRAVEKFIINIRERY